MEGQEDQVGCFENAAAHLTDDGCFVVEAIVPSFLHELPRGRYVEAEAVGVAEVRLDVGRHDRSAQTLEEYHVRLTDDRVLLQPIVTRCAWPSELDLMARIAGLRLKERWGSWQREPFTASSGSHVSVYGRSP
ncbi:MAG: hypothetical protein ABR613_06005 [Actinomycetota bacterium]